GGGETSSESSNNNQSATNTPETTQPVQSQTPAAAATETPAESADPASNDVVELTISGTDQMQFDKKELRVKAGQKVRLTLTHSGTMAKNAMGHNWVLLKEGVDLAAF